MVRKNAKKTEEKYQEVIKLIDGHNFTLETADRVLEELKKIKSFQISSIEQWAEVKDMLYRLALETEEVGNTNGGGNDDNGSGVKKTGNPTVPTATEPNENGNGNDDPDRNSRDDPEDGNQDNNDLDDFKDQMPDQPNNHSRQKTWSESSDHSVQSKMTNNENKVGIVDSELKKSNKLSRFSKQIKRQPVIEPEWILKQKMQQERKEEIAQLSSAVELQRNNYQTLQKSKELSAQLESDSLVKGLREDIMQTELQKRIDINMRSAEIDTYQVLNSK